MGRQTFYIRASLLSIVVLCSFSCASFRSEMEEQTLGINQWKIRDEFGQPDLTQPFGPGEEAWAYIRSDDLCFMQFKDQLLSEKPVCQDHGQWASDDARRVLERKAALIAATKTATETAAAKAKAEATPLHPMPPLEPVPGFDVKRPW